jgi:hypothetical protein
VADITDAVPTDMVTPEIIITPENTETLPAPSETEIPNIIEITPEVITSPIVGSETPSPFNTLYTENFEIESLSNWSLGEGWSRAQTENGFALQSTQMLQRALFNPLVSDTEITFQVRWDNGRVHLHTHNNGLNEYQFSLSSDLQAILYRNGVIVSTALTPEFVSVQWQTITYRKIGSNIEILLNNAPLLQYFDTEPLTSGQIALSAEGMTRAQWDEMSVKSGEVTLVNPNEIITEVALIEPQVESLTPLSMTWTDLIREDFESGWAEPEGFFNLGQFSRLDTNQTVLAPRNNRPTRLQMDSAWDMALQTDVLMPIGVAELVVRANGQGQYRATFDASGVVTTYFNEQILATTIVPAFANTWTQIRLEVISTTLQVFVNGQNILTLSDTQNASEGIAYFTGGEGVHFDHIVLQTPDVGMAQAFSAMSSSSSSNRDVRPVDRVFYTQNYRLKMYDGINTIDFISYNSVTAHETETETTNYYIRGVGKFEWSADKHWLAFECVLATDETTTVVGFQDLCANEYDMLGYLVKSIVLVKTDDQYEKWGSWQYTDLPNYSFVYTKTGEVNTVFTNQINYPNFASFTVAVPTGYEMNEVIYGRDSSSLYYTVYPQNNPDISLQGIYRDGVPVVLRLELADIPILPPPNDPYAFHHFNLWYASSNNIIYSFSLYTNYYDGYPSLAQELYRLDVKPNGQSPVKVKNLPFTLLDRYIAGFSYDGRLIYRLFPRANYTSYEISTIDDMLQTPPVAKYITMLDTFIQQIYIDSFPSWIPTPYFSAVSTYCNVPTTQNSALYDEASDTSFNYGEMNGMQNFEVLAKNYNSDWYIGRGIRNSDGSTIESWIPGASLDLTSCFQLAKIPAFQNGEIVQSCSGVVTQNAKILLFNNQIAASAIQSAITNDLSIEDGVDSSETISRLEQRTLWDKSLFFSNITDMYFRYKLDANFGISPLENPIRLYESQSIEGITISSDGLGQVTIGNTDYWFSINYGLFALPCVTESRIVDLPEFSTSVDVSNLFVTNLDSGNGVPYLDSSMELAYLSRYIPNLQEYTTETNGCDETVQCPNRIYRRMMVDANNRFDKLIINVANNEGVPPKFLKLLLMQESNLIPALTANRSKALGIGQITPVAVAQLLGVQVDNPIVLPKHLALDGYINNSQNCSMGYFDDLRVSYPLSEKDCIDWAEVEDAIQSSASLLTEFRRLYLYLLQQSQNGSQIYNNWLLLPDKGEGIIWSLAVASYNTGPGAVADATLDANPKTISAICSQLGTEPQKYIHNIALGIPGSSTINCSTIGF